MFLLWNSSESSLGSLQRAYSVSILNSWPVAENSDYISVSVSLQVLFLGGKSFHSPARALLAIVLPPWTSPSKWGRKRDHPSASLLRIFMTGCLVPQRFLTGRGSCSKVQEEDGALMTRWAPWLEGATEAQRERERCRLYPDVWTVTDVCCELHKRRPWTFYCKYTWK